MTDPAAAAGRLELAFAAGDGRTVLQRRDHTWPYSVGRVFYAAGSDPASVIVQSGSGGIITGDRLRQRFSAGPGARARVLGQGAMSVHRAGRGAGSGEDLELDAAPGSWIENLAEPRVLFGDSDFAQHTAIAIHGDGVAVSVEAVVFNTFDSWAARYRSSIEVRHDGLLRARERMAFTGQELPAGMTAFALVVAAGLRYRAESWREWAGGCGDTTLYGAANALPFEAGLAVRLVAADGRRLREGAVSALQIIRRN